MIKVKVKETPDTFEFELPKSFCQKVDLRVGDSLFMSIEGQSLVLSKHQPVTLEQLLEGSEREDFSLSQEDHDWLNG